MNRSPFIFKNLFRSLNELPEIIFRKSQVVSVTGYLTITGFSQVAEVLLSLTFYPYPNLYAYETNGVPQKRNSV